MNLVLEIVYRKVYIERLGTDVVGLNTTAYNMLGFLNLAELGVGAAVAFTLYKPLFDRNVKSINEIVNLQGWLYRRIAGVIIVGGIILMSFFPLIFGDMTLPMWYSYASFGVLLYSALLTYFINIWLGEEFILNHVILGLLVYEMYINVQRPIANAFTMGYGMYQDVWSACAEAVLNLGFSILLGYFFGLEGVICGVIISLFLIVEIWKPLFLYHWGFHISILKYVKMYVIHILIAAVVWAVCYLCYSSIFNPLTDSILTFIISGAFACGSFFY